MNTAIEKVTALITHQSPAGTQLLLFQHPYAGIQIPAGTVEASESPEAAVLREVLEETGLSISTPPAYLGCQETQLPDGEAILLPPVTVYARPDKTSFDWIQIRSGVQVEVLRQVEGFTQIHYTEPDQIPNPNYVSMQITGWVTDESLATLRKRYFYQIDFEGKTKSRWQTFSDHHIFTVFWAPLNDLPIIIPPQDSWLEFLPKQS